MGREEPLFRRMAPLFPMVDLDRILSYNHKPWIESRFHHPENEELSC